MERWKINFANKLKRLIASGNHITVKSSQASIVLTDNNTKEKIRYTDSQNSFELFHTINKIKSNIDNLLKPESYKVRNIDCMYNFSNRKFNYYGNEKIYAIDISSCYITIARNTGLISQELFDIAKSMKKDDRLKLMGLLAYKPIITEYNNGQLIKNYIQKNEYEQYFFFLVKKTDDIFVKLMEKLQYHGAFFWVDCIFFKETGSNINLVSDFLKSKRLKFTITRCFKFKLERTETNDKYSMFKYNGKNKMEYKSYEPKILSAGESNKRNELLEAIYSNNFKKMLNIINSK